MCIGSSTNLLYDFNIECIGVDISPDAVKSAIFNEIENGVIKNSSSSVVVDNDMNSTSNIILRHIA